MKGLAVNLGPMSSRKGGRERNTAMLLAAIEAFQSHISQNISVFESNNNNDAIQLPRGSIVPRCAGLLPVSREDGC